MLEWPDSIEGSARWWGATNRGRESAPLGRYRHAYRRHVSPSYDPSMATPRRIGGLEAGGKTP